jgi:hypothetical protein
MLNSWDLYEGGKYFPLFFGDMINECIGDKFGWSKRILTCGDSVLGLSKS